MTAKYFFFVMILLHSVFAENSVIWSQSPRNTFFEKKGRTYFLRPAISSKKGQIFLKQKTHVYQGYRFELSGNFSGTAEFSLGYHYYDNSGKWLGMITGAHINLCGQASGRSDFTIKDANIDHIRPFLEIYSGALQFDKFNFTAKNSGYSPDLSSASIFSGWKYESGSQAQAIRLSGDGNAATSFLAVATAPHQKCSIFDQSSIATGKDCKIKILFRIRGCGTVHAGLHLYDLGNRWLGKLEKEQLLSDNEANFKISPSAGNKKIHHVRPYFTIFPKSSVSIGRIRLLKQQEIPEKPEVKIPLPQGYHLLTFSGSDFPVRFFPSERRIILDYINTPFNEFGAETASLLITLIDCQTKKILASRKFTFQESHIQNQSVYLPQNYEGTFYVQGTYLNRHNDEICKGRGYTGLLHMDLTTGRYQVANMLCNRHFKKWVQSYPMGTMLFKQKKYPFLTRKHTRHQFPDFSRIALTHRTAALDLRQYTYGENGFLTGIISRQPEPTVGDEYEQILSAPLKLTHNNRTIALAASDFIQKDKSIYWEQNTYHGGAQWKIKNRLDPDGVQRMDITVLPSENFSAGKISLLIPLKSSQATLFQNVTDTTYRRKDPSLPLGKTILGGHAGFTPIKQLKDEFVWESRGQDRKTPGSFIPYIWLGNEDRGFCYFSDDDKDWLIDSNHSALAISRKDNQVFLHINFVNQEPARISRELHWTIGLLSTPVKLPLPHWRGTVFPRWMTMDQSFYSNLNNCRKIIIVSAGHPYFNAGTQSIISSDINRTKSMYDAVRDSFRSTYMEYYCSDELNLNIPELQSFFSEWSVLPANGEVSGKSVRRPSKSYDYTSATIIGTQRFVPSYLSYRLWAIENKLNRIGELSFYEDNIHLRCFYDPARNQGHRDSQGKIHPSYDIWSLRDYYHSLAGLYKKHNFDNLTGAHASASLLIPALTNCTFFIDGEQPSRYDTDISKDYIDYWKDLDYMRAVSMGRAFGINTIFLSEITFNGKDEDGHHSRAWLALILPHDLAPWDGNIKNREPVKMWHKIINDLNFYHESPRFYPYWSRGKNQAAKHMHKDLIVTLWKQQKQTLIMLSNLGDAGNFSVELLAENLGIKSIYKLTDLENSESVNIQNNKFKTHVARHDFKLLLAQHP